MTKWTLWLFVSGAILVFAVMLFVLPIGYDMSAVVFAGIAAVITFFALCRNKTARIAATVLLVLGFGCFLSAEIPVIRGAHSDEKNDAPYLIVMGAGIRGTDPTPSMQDRLTQAKAWLDAHSEAAVIVSGSQAEDEITSEAAVMRAWLLENGIEASRILFEDKADSSYENIENSLALIKAAGGDPQGRVAIVSSEYHLCRIRRLAEHLGCEPCCIAAPTSEFTLKLNMFLREAFALWEIRIFGIDA